VGPDRDADAVEVAVTQDGTQGVYAFASQRLWRADFITERSFASVGELSEAIIGFLAERNKNTKRYVWRAKGEDILRKIEAAQQAMAANQATLPC
jgi:hypothetical protein